MRKELFSLALLVACSSGICAGPAPAEDLKEIYATVDKLEKNHLGSTHSRDLLETRLNRLDKKVFGEVQSGDVRERIDALTVKSPHSEPEELKSRESVAAEKQPLPEKSSSRASSSRIESDAQVEVKPESKPEVKPESKPDSEINWPAYVGKASKLLKQNWFPPKYEGTNRKVDLIIRIARDGTIQNVKVGKTSGFQDLDYSALKSSRDVGKLPPLPAGSRDFIDIQVTFDQALKAKSD